MKITFYGHASLGIQIEDVHLLIDPFITGNPLAKHIDVETLKADYILLTHAHEDHTLDVENIAQRTGAIIISNFEIVSYYEKKGIQGHSMNFGGCWDFDFGNVRYVNAIHSSSFVDGSYGGQPGGFIIKNKQKTIYISGDTALHYDMKLISLQYKLDLAILPIGGNFTMDMHDAVIASDFVECNKVLGTHYDTFGFIKIDKAKAQHIFQENKKELILLGIGETLDL